jgi:hypothetical protein
MITDLQDRIQNYLHDLNGEPWCKKVEHFEDKMEKRKSEIETDKNIDNRHEITTIIKQSLSGDETSPRRDDNEDKNRNKYDILFLHDSICNAIEMRRLIAGSDRNGEKAHYLLTLLKRQVHSYRRSIMPKLYFNMLELTF